MEPTLGIERIWIGQSRGGGCSIRIPLMALSVNFSIDEWQERRNVPKNWMESIDRKDERNVKILRIVIS